MATPEKSKELLQILMEIRGEKEINMADKQELIIETTDGKQKWCPSCEAYLPANEEYFYKDGRSASKLSSWCRKCQRTKQQATDTGKIQPLKAARKAGRADIISLDFSRDQDLLNGLLIEAKKERRTPDQQVMWWLERQICGTGDRI